MTNIQHFLIHNSPSQEIFILSKWGYMINKGHLKGHLINDLNRSDREGLIEFLDGLFNDQNSNINTKRVIRDIQKTLKIKY